MESIRNCKFNLNTRVVKLCLFPVQRSSEEFIKADDKVQNTDSTSGCDSSDNLSSFKAPLHPPSKTVQVQNTQIIKKNISIYRYSCILKYKHLHTAS